MHDLVLHVGLPKTGTTTLQRELFPQHPGHLGGVSSRDNPGDHLTRFHVLLKAFHAQRDEAGRLRPGPDADRWRADLAAWWALARERSPGPLVLSSEMLSFWNAGPSNRKWPMMTDSLEEEGIRHGEHPMVMLVRTIADELGDEVRLRTIITLRNQADFAGSLYAEHSRYLRRASSEDLAAKVRHMIATGDRFLDWEALVAGLRSVCGDDDVCVCVFEDGLEAVAARMAAFVDPDWHPTIDLDRRNVRSAGQAAWTADRQSTIRVATDALPGANRVLRVLWPPSVLPGVRLALADGLVRTVGTVRRVAERREKAGRTSKVTVTMSPELRADVRTAFAASNARLAATLGRDLAPLGY